MVPTGVPRSMSLNRFRACALKVRLYLRPVPAWLNMPPGSAASASAQAAGAKTAARSATRPAASSTASAARTAAGDA